MDGGDDRAAHVGHLLHLSHDDERGSGVESGRGLVEEEHRRVRDELDGDGEHLSLTGRESVCATAHADHSPGDGPELQDVERLLDEAPTLRRGHLSSQAKLSGELQGLLDGGELVVKVHLLAVRGESGKRLLLNLVTVELNGTLANATGLATGDDVEKGGLARAGRAHEREEALGARR